MGYIHPRLEDVPLAAKFHALSHRVRLRFVRLLLEHGTLSNIKLAADLCPKSSSSIHLNVLRSAGLIRTTRKGRTLQRALRKGDSDSLDDVLKVVRHHSACIECGAQVVRGEGEDGHYSENREIRA